MKASEASLISLLRQSPQFIIPIYQRSYSWTEKECRQLWDDIIRCGKNDNIAVHFVGSIVYIQSGLSQVTHQSPLLVIDGQQRLTTITLLLAALAEAVKNEEPFDGFSQRKIRNYFLLNPDESGDRQYKLLLSQTDKDTLTSIVSATVSPKTPSIRINENYEFFKSLIHDYRSDLATLCKGIAKLVVVDIALNRDQDNPQLIFESMNSTGKELSQADLIRNFVLMGLEPQLQTHLYDQYWRPMEVDFGQDAYVVHFDAFMRHYLTVKTGEIPNINLVYDAFKKFVRESQPQNDEPNTHIERVVKDIRNFSRHYCAMALGQEEEHELKEAFADLRELKVDVAYPFLLEIYDDFKMAKLNKDDLISSIRLVESYLFRRAICAIPSNSLSKTFGSISKALKKERYIESIQAHFLTLPSYRRFPSDTEFERDIQTRDLYNFRSRSYWLRRMENFGIKSVLNVEVCTIEHIMPQNENLKKEWQIALGNEWRKIHSTYLHTLGNLTLTHYNAEYSDRSFAQKRDMDKGFKNCNLNLNQGIGKLEVWNEASIVERGQKLAQKALQVWTSPKLDSAVLQEYQAPKAMNPSYTINDHPNLLDSKFNPIFVAFRKSVLALDPNISEEFLKRYVAYKAETNFVDVYALSSKLKLTINLQFHELQDPKGICIDISGRRLNGEVEASISSMEELPYVLGLVRQALEKQLGDTSD